MVNKPLIRPAISWGVALVGVARIPLTVAGWMTRREPVHWCFAPATWVFWARQTSSYTNRPRSGAVHRGHLESFWVQVTQDYLRLWHESRNGNRVVRLPLKKWTYPHCFVLFTYSRWPSILWGQIFQNMGHLGSRCIYPACQRLLKW